MITDVWITHHPTSGMMLTSPRPVVPWPFHDHFPIDGPLLEHFMLQESDYEMGDDQLVCPCGEVLERDRSEPLGVAMEIAREHLRERHGR